ncbi:unnamed protein product [Chrysoparadoxa australica]
MQGITVLGITLALFQLSLGFIMTPLTAPRITPRFMSMNTQGFQVQVKLEKPLGLVLEENVAGEAQGVRVKSCVEGGTALECGQISAGMVLLEVLGSDCRNLGFEDVMQRLVEAPADTPIPLIFEVSAEAPAEEEEEEAPPSKPSKPETCNLRVMKPGSTAAVTITGVTVGGNLRRKLLDSDMELYDMLGKMTNCNGSGQCATCVVAVEGEGWSERSEWEDNKLKNRPSSHRLACQTMVEGDAVITLKPKK